MQKGNIMNKFNSFEEYCASLKDSDILRKFYKNNYAEFYVISDVLNSLINRYKNVPMTKHVLTDYEKEMIAKDPSYIELVPRMEIKGYDRVAGGEVIEQEIKQEFVRKFRNHDGDLFMMLKRNPYFRESVPFA